MSLTLKRQLATILLSQVLPRLRNDENTFNRILAAAVKLQKGEATDEEFRRKLDEFYAGLDLDRVKQDLDYNANCKRLSNPGGYKVGVVRLHADAPAGSWRQRYSPWGRRFYLLKHLGVDADVIIVRQDETIPPHGHYRVVSGFYVLEGEVAVRHYDRLEEIGDKVRIRKTIDTTLGPRGYTTNSEFHDNIHWLQGLAPQSFLFRLNVKGTPTETFGSPDRESQRVYVDPTGEPDQSGEIIAKYVDESAAKQLKIRPTRACVAL